ncbi:Serine-protein kinase RsbW [Actinokineospora spheciospongiae]|uniref:Serine-protein kinase RsbW n=1 Tax=Actinokineospora spheciospongiae TaxID=909613 RepID=W7IT87_9PSEU|nr:ATP-binding protein [Actinokineospora spheciospongiae]EWC59977.1 Serine-protein kinase RsbW [Actinokineospora spheciospongiae]PWW59512.1 serine/threonine-protein kinase RsbW [Actinokineospora spheciospongiae]
MIASGRRVRVEFDADLALLPVVRAMAANVAMVEDFTIDDISDVRLAVDEMCSTLITHAVLGSTLDCQIDTRPGGLAVRASVDSRSSQPSRDTMSWEIMSVLADSVTSEVHTGPAGTARLTMCLTKRRGEG